LLLLFSCAIFGPCNLGGNFSIIIINLGLPPISDHLYVLSDVCIMFIALFIVVLRDKNIWHAVILLKFGDKIFGVVEQPGKNIGLNSADALVMEV
jgi:hypothetical protein